MINDHDQETVKQLVELAVRRSENPQCAAALLTIASIHLSKAANVPAGHAMHALTHGYFHVGHHSLDDLVAEVLAQLSTPSVPPAAPEETP